MKDILGWSCEEGCNCQEEGHMHHDDPRLLEERENKTWWQSIFGK